MLRIESLKIQNYRALKKLELSDLTPLTVFVGPNGSGKATIFDALEFLSECFQYGLRKAWDKRGRFRELRTRGSEAPIVIELAYRETANAPLTTYHLSISEENNGPVVEEEWLQSSEGPRGNPFRFVDFKYGAGKVSRGDNPDVYQEQNFEQLSSPDLLAVGALGQFTKHPKVSALRQFITGSHFSYLSSHSARCTPEPGPQHRLSATGDNLANVIQYFEEQYPAVLDGILRSLSAQVPRLETVDAKYLQDGRLTLQIKDAPFAQPNLAKFASEGLLTMLKYLLALGDPNPPQLIGMEAPEVHLHPRLLSQLAEECRAATINSQLLVTTHSPVFVSAVRAQELWVLYRDEVGFTHARKAADMRGVTECLKEGALLGDLWMEGFFEVGDPLTNARRT